MAAGGGGGGALEALRAAGPGAGPGQYAAAMAAARAAGDAGQVFEILRALRLFLAPDARCLEIALGAALEQGAEAGAGQLVEVLDLMAEQGVGIADAAVTAQALSVLDRAGEQGAVVRLWNAGQVPAGLLEESPEAFLAVVRALARGGEAGLAAELLEAAVDSGRGPPRPAFDAVIAGLSAAGQFDLAGEVMEWRDYL